MIIKAYCYDCGDSLYITNSECLEGNHITIEARACGNCLQQNSDGMYERGRKDEREEDNE